MAMVTGFLSVYSNRGYFDYNIIPLENRKGIVTVFMMHSIFFFFSEPITMSMSTAETTVPLTTIEVDSSSQSTDPDATVNINPAQSGSGGCSTGCIVGIVVGCVVLVLLVTVITVIIVVLIIKK